eukprot:2999469-Lingulodinium_polyedra.AAC.1
MWRHARLGVRGRRVGRQAGAARALRLPPVLPVQGRDRRVGPADRRGGVPFRQGVAQAEDEVLLLVQEGAGRPGPGEPVAGPCVGQATARGASLRLLRCCSPEVVPDPDHGGRAADGRHPEGGVLPLPCVLGQDDRCLQERRQGGPPLERQPAPEVGQ